MSQVKLNPYINQILLPSKNLSEKIKQDLDIHKIKTNNKKSISKETTAPIETIKRSLLTEIIKAAN